MQAPGHLDFRRRQGGFRLPQRVQLGSCPSVEIEVRRREPLSVSLPKYLMNSRVFVAVRQPGEMAACTPVRNPLRNAPCKGAVGDVGILGAGCQVVRIDHQLQMHHAGRSDLDQVIVVEGVGGDMLSMTQPLLTR